MKRHENSLNRMKCVFHCQIYNELFRLAEEYSHSVKLINLGKSHEQRNMLGIEVRCSEDGIHQEIE